MVQFASYLRRVLGKTRLIFPRINDPNVPELQSSIVCTTQERPSLVSDIDYLGG